jgi:hypothetical protein
VKSEVMWYPVPLVWAPQCAGNHGGEAISRNGTPPHALAKQYIRYEIPPLCR